MSKITPEQQRKISALAEILEKGDFAVLEKLLEFQDIIESMKGEIGDFLNSSSETMTSHTGEVLKGKEAIENAISKFEGDINESQNQIGELTKELLAIKKRNITDEVKQEISKSIAELNTILLSQIESVRRLIPSLPPKVDLTEIFNRLVEIEQSDIVLEKDLPKHGEKFRDGLEILVGDERLRIEAIKNLREELDALKKMRQTTIGGVIGIKDIIAGNNVTISHTQLGYPVIHAGGGGSPNFSAGTTSNNLGSVVFSNSNGVSFGLNGSTITASVDAAGGGLTNVNLSAGTTSNNLSNFVFSNSNGVSFGLNGSTVTATVQTNYLTTAMLSNAVTLSNINLSAGTTSNNLSAFVFSNSNNVSFGLNGSTVTATITVPAQSNQNMSLFALGNTTQNSSTLLNASNLSFNGLGIVTAGFSNGSIQLSATQSNQAFSAAGGSSAFQTLSFGDTNGVSFTNTNGSVGIASVKLSMFAVSNTTQSSSGTANHSALSFGGAGAASVGVTGGSVVISAPAQTNQQMTMFATGNTTLSSSGTSNASSLIFRGSGAASVGITNGSILIDVAAGAAAITQSIGMSTQTAGGATGGTTGYATGDDVLYHFVPGSNITMSQSINGASGTLSIYGPAAGGGATLSGFNPFNNREINTIVGGNASLYMNPLDLPCAVQFDRFGFWMTGSNATNSSGSATISAFIGIYTRNVSSLSLLASTSFSTAITQSGTVGSYSNYGGIKILPIPWTTTLSASNYWVGIISRTTTGGANMSFGNMGISQVASTWSGFFGSGSNATNHSQLGEGIYSVSTAALPAAISFTQINANSSAFHRLPAYQFISNIL